MACRDLKRCETAREQLVIDTKNPNIICKECDLASFDSVRKFCEE